MKGQPCDKNLNKFCQVSSGCDDCAIAHPVTITLNPDLTSINVSGHWEVSEQGSQLPKPTSKDAAILVGFDVDDKPIIERIPNTLPEAVEAVVDKALRRGYIKYAARELLQTLRDKFGWIDPTNEDVTASMERIMISRGWTSPASCLKESKP